MDRRAPATPAHREIVHCHECQEEWYRDEHGLQCPSCRGDFVEILEGSGEADTSSDMLAEDPDEDDIEQLNWSSQEADQVPHEQYRLRYERQRSGQQQAPQQQQGGWTGLLGNVLRLASDIIQPPNRDSQQREEADAQPQEFVQRQVGPDGSTYTRHVQGNGFSFTMTTQTHGLQPRDPDIPQPFQRQPQDMNEMMQQIFQNIGVRPPGVHPGFPGNDFVMNPEMGHAASPFPALFQLLGLPNAAVHGDAVYSQEGLDRIISQLMEQHQTGNAPGPASASAIDSLPQREIDEKDLGDTGTAECSICMDSVELGATVTVLPCKHWFHFDCIKAWLSEHDTCPHCRKGITAPEEGGQQGQSSRPRVPGAFPRPGQSEGLSDRMRDIFGPGSH